MGFDLREMTSVEKRPGGSPTVEERRSITPEERPQSALKHLGLATQKRDGELTARIEARKRLKSA